MNSQQILVHQRSFQKSLLYFKLKKLFSIFRKLLRNVFMFRTGKGVVTQIQTGELSLSTEDILRINTKYKCRGLN